MNAMVTRTGFGDVSTWKRALARLGLELGYFTGIARILARRTGGLGVILRFERVKPRVPGGFQPLRSLEITPSLANFFSE